MAVVSIRMNHIFFFKFNLTNRTDLSAVRLLIMTSHGLNQIHGWKRYSTIRSHTSIEKDCFRKVLSLIFSAIKHTWRLYFHLVIFEFSKPLFISFHINVTIFIDLRHYYMSKDILPQLSLLVNNYCNLIKDSRFVMGDKILKTNSVRRLMHTESWMENYFEYNEQFNFVGDE